MLINYSRFVMKAGVNTHTDSLASKGGESTSRISPKSRTLKLNMNYKFNQRKRIKVKDVSGEQNQLRKEAV